MKLIALIPFWASFNLEKKTYKNTLLNLTWKVTLQIKSVLAAQELLKIKVSMEPCLVSVVVLMRGCSGTGE